MVTMILAQGIPLVAPYGGAAPLLGNAPVGWGVPAGRNPAVIVDMSLTQTSAKGVVRAARQGEPVPAGFILDAEGRPTTDAGLFVDPHWLAQGKTVARGSLVPIGDSHKSYALVFVVGLLTSLLAGGDFAWKLGNDAPVPGKFSSLFLVIDPAAFGDRAAMLARVDEYIDQLRGSHRRPGAREILYPGERSQALKRSRAQADVLELPVAQYAALMALRDAT
jgi:LDH2 family malate/lactate/ureidoglycolate dehydrogenase